MDGPRNWLVPASLPAAVVPMMMVAVMAIGLHPNAVAVPYAVATVAANDPVGLLGQRRGFRRTLQRGEA